MNTIRRITAALVLVSFLGIILGSFAVMMHSGSEHALPECPLSAMSAAQCPEDSVGSAVHHVSAYNAFLTAAVPNLLVLLAALGLVLLYIFRYIHAADTPRLGFAYIRHSLHTRDTSRDKVHRWLAHLETSPTPS